MNWLAKIIIRIAMKDPYFHLPGYMNRWWLVRERWVRIGRWQFQLPAIRVHQILRSDDDRHLHDHPRNSISIILSGSYMEVLEQEHMPHGVFSILWKAPMRKPWRPIFRRAKTPHRLIVPEGEVVWSLFITWGRRREWGFHTENGWVQWEEYLRSKGLHQQVPPEYPWS